MAIDIAVIGTGWADRVQIPAFQAAGLRVVGVASRDPERARRLAGEHGVPFATDRWQDLLELPCRLISVTSPPALHCEQTIAVLEAGKGVLCEKPMALDGDEAGRMLAAAAAHPDALALVDHELRFTPARLKARELLRSGGVGRVLTVTARVAQGGRTDPAAPWTWWSDAAQGGGVLGALGSHVLDGIRWLLDCDIEMRGATLGQVYGQRRDADGTSREVTADDLASLTFRAGDAVGTALIHAAALDEGVDLLTIRGTEGTLAIDRSLKLYYGKRRGPLKEWLTALPSEVPNRFRSSGYAAGTVLMGSALRRYFEGDQGALAQAATLADGRAVQALLDRARELGRQP